MSSTIDDVVCPECGGNARMEQDTETCETHTWCDECDYDSDDEDDDYFEDDYFEDDWD